MGQSANLRLLAVGKERFFVKGKCEYDVKSFWRHYEVHIISGFHLKDVCII